MGFPKLFFGWPILMVFFVLLSGPDLSSANPPRGSPFIKNFKPIDYHAHPQNFAILEDRRGVMYFGNTYGVLEYDSVNWRLIPIVNGSQVRGLNIDSRGTIYVGGIGEFGYLEADSSGRLSYRSLLTKIKDPKLKFDRVHSIFVIEDRIFFITEVGIFLFDQYTVTEIPMKIRKGAFLIHDQIYVYNTQGIFRYQDSGLEHLPGSETLTDSSNSIMIMIPYGDLDILIAKSNRGLFRYRFTSPNDTAPALESFKTESDAFFRENIITSGIMIDPNTYAIGTWKSGIMLMDTQGHCLQVIDTRQGLNKNLIHSLFLDSNYHLWAAMNIGIAYIETHSPWSVFDERSGLNDFVVDSNHFKEDWYVGSYNGLFKFQGSDNPLKGPGFHLVKDFSYTCMALMSTPQGMLAGGTSGIYLMGQNQEVHLIIPGTVYSFAVNPRFPDIILYGMERELGALQIVTRAGGKLEIKNLPPSGSAKLKMEGPLYKMVSEPSGDLWITAMWNGLNHLQFSGNRWDEFTLTHYSTADGLPSNTRNKVNWVNGQMLIGTQAGIYVPVRQPGADGKPRYRFVPQEAMNRPIQEKNFSVDKIEAISPDKYYLFCYNPLSSGLGVLEKKKDGTFQLDTLPFRKIKAELQNFRIEDNGLIAMATDNGLFHYNTRLTNSSQSIFQCLIRQIQTGKGTILYFGTSPQTASPVSSASNPKTVLSYSENSLIFSFCAAFYENTEDTRFSSQLRGFDSAWSLWQPEPKREYTNLSEGDYTFQVKGKNVYDQESLPAGYSFQILPPWYRTYWAYLIYLVGFFLFIIALLHVNSQRLVAAKQRLEKTVEERTAEVVSQRNKIEAQNDLMQDAYNQMYSMNKQLTLTNLELEKLSIVARETDNAVIIMDPQGHFEFVNAAFTRLYGMTLQELREKMGDTLDKASNNPAVRMYLERCRKEKQSITFENYTRNRFGKEIWTQTTLTPILDDQGEVKKLVVVDSNITEIKNAQNQIDGILKSVGDGLLVTDIENRILLMNRAAEDLLRIRFSRVANQPMNLVLENQIFIEKIKQTMNEKREGLEFDFEIKGDADEPVRTLRARTSAILDAVGHFRGIVTSLIDVTLERKVDRMKTDFLSTAAHELRTPLTTIRGFSELLLTQSKDIEENEKTTFMQYINEQSVVLAKLINDLLDISRIESGIGFVMNWDQQDILPLLKSCLIQFQQTSKTHQFQLNLPDQPVSFIFDKEKIQQVILNILSNAVKYSPDGGLITITGEITENSFQVTVTDPGIGMTPDQLERVFDKFYRADDTSPIKGTGLGMSIVKKIIEKHKGGIRVKSNRGHANFTCPPGTSVIFTLPLK